MEDLPLGRTAALVPEFAEKDLTLGRTLDDDDDDYTYYLMVSASLAETFGVCPS